MSQLKTGGATLYARVLTLVAIGMCAAAIQAAPGGDWPQFRGPDRNGISTETGLLQEWPEGGPPVVWRQPIGPGYSEISAVAGRMYTADGDDAEQPDGGEPVGNEFVMAMDSQTTEEIWRVPIGPKTFNEFGNGPRTTPTVDGDTVFMLSGHGKLLALSIADGSTRWEIDLIEIFGTGQAEYGFATSPVVIDGVVVLDVGGPEEKSHAGLDRDTGEVKWANGKTGAFGTGYSSVLPVDIDGQIHLVHLAGLTLRAVDAPGNELWSTEWPRGETHAMPTFIPPSMLFASGAGAVGSTVVRVDKNGDGFTTEEVWKSPLMRNHFSSTLYHDRYLYGFDNATLKCLDAMTGEQKWAKRGFGKGALIFADGNLIVLSDRGRLALVEATSEAYREKGSVQALTGKSWTAPSLADGRLYLRNHTEKVAYDLTSQGD